MTISIQLISLWFRAPIAGSDGSNTALQASLGSNGEGRCSITLSFDRSLLIVCLHLLSPHPCCIWCLLSCYSICVLLIWFASDFYIPFCLASFFESSRSCISAMWQSTDLCPCFTKFHVHQVRLKKCYPERYSNYNFTHKCKCWVKIAIWIEGQCILFTSNN